MALTPEDIEQHIFKVARRGYDKVEVDRFMGEVAKSYREVQSMLDGVSTGTGTTADVTGGSPLPVRTPGATTEGGGELFSFDRGPAPPPRQLVVGRVHEDVGPACGDAVVDPPDGDGTERPEQRPVLLSAAPGDRGQGGRRRGCAHPRRVRTRCPA